MAQNPPRDFTPSFSTSNLAASATADLSLKNDNTRTFVATAIVASVRAAAAGAHGLAGTEFVRDINSGAASLVPNVGLIGVQFGQGSWNYSKTYVPLNNVSGTGEKPHYLTEPRVFPPGCDMYCRLQNNSDRNVNIDVTYIGYYKD